MSALRQHLCGSSQFPHEPREGCSEFTTPLAELFPGDPIPPERTGGMTGFVVGECGHRLAGSEWAAGFRNCERCGA
jgi:hypothetical protein